MKTETTRVAAALILALAFVTAVPASAQALYKEAESGDAGSDMATAADLTGDYFSRINGSITPYDMDVFKIYIDDPSTFYAKTEVEPMSMTGTYLYLFRADGTCEYSNYQSSAGSNYSTLPAGHSAGPQTPGVYYLAIARYGATAMDAYGQNTCADPASPGPMHGVNDANVSASTFDHWSNVSGGGGTYRIHMTTASSLPVELAGFEAVVAGSDVHLSWTTVSESDNAGFDIQVAREQGFETVGFVSGFGTTSKSSTYRYVLTGLPYGTHRLRLRQVDMDGNYRYSPTVLASIDLPGAHAVSNVYPNPTAGSASMTVAVTESQDVDVAVFDLLGRRVRSLYRGTLEAQLPMTVDVRSGDLPTGLYMVRVIGERFTESRPVSVVR